MMPGSDPEKPAIGFVENTNASGGSYKGSHTPLNVPSSSATGAHGSAAELQMLPSYAQILSSEDTVSQKVTTLYQVSKARVQFQFASVKPWTEFFDRTYFATPQGTSDVVNRLNKNISYFYSNYIILSLLCSSYVLLINPVFSICVAVMVFFYFYVRSRAAAMAEDETSDGMIYLFGKSFTPMQLYLTMLIFGVLMFYFTSGSSVVFWLLVTSLGVTCGHASMRRPPMEEHSAFALA